MSGLSLQKCAPNFKYVALTDVDRQTDRQTDRHTDRHIEGKHYIRHSLCSLGGYNYDTLCLTDLGPIVWTSLKSPLS